MSLAIRQYAFGGPEQLVLEEVPDPVAGVGQVRIRVEASGVHLIDTVQRRGGSGGPLGVPSLPMTPGREVAGVVDAVGPGVDERLLGSPVVAQLELIGGGYAELALADATATHQIPDGVDAATAVTMIGTGRTAIAIAEVAAIQPTDTVLILAAAGGIGSLLVQLASAAGATVLAAVSHPSKAARPLSLGAHHVFTYDNPAWTEDLEDMMGRRSPTLVVDGVGGSTGRAALEQAAIGGRVLLHGASSGQLTELTATDLFTRGITVSSAVGVRILQRPDGMKRYESVALAAAADRTLRDVVGARFQLADAAAAHEELEARNTVGKIVLIP